MVMEEWTLPGYEIDLFGDVYPTTGTTGIGSDGYLDCAETCVPSEVYDGHFSAGLFSDYVFFSWLGDEDCDAGGYGVDFACAYYEWDFGDCESDAADGGTSGGFMDDAPGGGPTPGSACTADTPEGPVDGTTDCTGMCFGVPYAAMVHYTTDGICDDGESVTAIDLNCVEFDYDGGSCIGG